MRATFPANLSFNAMWNIRRYVINFTFSYGRIIFSPKGNAYLRKFWVGNEWGAPQRINSLAQSRSALCECPHTLNRSLRPVSTRNHSIRKGCLEADFSQVKCKLYKLFLSTFHFKFLTQTAPPTGIRFMGPQGNLGFLVLMHYAAAENRFTALKWESSHT